ncbi:hypothetical protein SEA_GUILLAUME_74 [Gordonia phage Guillaume]|uniref:Uncharacterized protein n=1 Tax=Gordonia phage Guillaume TaxID=2510570 RepID=A0A411B1X5_9CAUD|nr:hypothetical protein SEA_GUILLAUME_74 [Gordonia phage Guillaume]
MNIKKIALAAALGIALGAPAVAIAQPTHAPAKVPMPCAIEIGPGQFAPCPPKVEQVGGPVAKDPGSPAAPETVVETVVETEEVEVVVTETPEPEPTAPVETETTEEN